MDEYLPTQCISWLKSVSTPFSHCDVSYLVAPSHRTVTEWWQCMQKHMFQCVCRLLAITVLLGKPEKESYRTAFSSNAASRFWLLSWIWNRQLDQHRTASVHLSEYIMLMREPHRVDVEWKQCWPRVITGIKREVLGSNLRQAPTCCAQLI